MNGPKKPTEMAWTPTTVIVALAVILLGIAVICVAGSLGLAYLTRR